MNISHRIPLPDDPALPAIVERVEAETGERFFASLARDLARALGVQYSFLTQLLEGGDRFKTLAVWERERLAPNFEMPIKGSPCESVLGGEISYHAQGLCALSPADKGFEDWHAESYCGLPVLIPRARFLATLLSLTTSPCATGRVAPRSCGSSRPGYGPRSSGCGRKVSCARPENGWHRTDGAHAQRHYERGQGAASSGAPGTQDAGGAKEYLGRRNQNLSWMRVPMNV